MWDEAIKELQTQEWNEDYEKRIAEKAETEPTDKKYLVKEMLGNDYALFFEDEQHEKHLWDSKHGL